MGLSASMWTSVSGLLAHGEKMNVVGNNIANVSTIGFKSQRVDFNDYLYINGGSTSGPTQIGAGVSTYAVIGDFSQGSLESTNSVTDLAIDGNGFFKVRQPNTEQMYYTRAGDFYFNADRQLQNPEGLRLQGWKIDNSTRLTFKSESVNLGPNSADESAFQGTGTPVDIVLDSWYLEPQRTSSVSFTMGLTSDGNADRSTSTTSPMTALFDQWDATKNPPMADSSYATSSSIKVYDEGGTAHTLTVYYDQVATKGNTYEIQGLPAGYTMYEYVVTIPPEEDMRSYGGQGYDPETNEFTGTKPTSFYNPDPDICNKNAGMLMTGHLIFDASGNLVNQTAYTYGGAETDMGDNNQFAGNPSDLASWQTTRFSSNGLPVFTANFTGQPLANTVNETTSNGKSQAQDYIIELDLGLRNLGGTNGDWTGGGTSLEDLRAATSSSPETVYKAAPTNGTAYPTGDNITYYYKDEDGNPVEVQVSAPDADGNQTISLVEAGTDGDGKPTTTTKVLDSNTPLFVKEWVDGPSLPLSTVTDQDFSGSATSKYYLTPLKEDANGKRDPIEVKIINGQIYKAEDVDDKNQPTGDPVDVNDFMADGNTFAYSIEQKVEKTVSAKKDFTFATDADGKDIIDKGKVLYRDSSGQYRNAYKQNGDGNWELVDAARGMSLYIQADEVVEHNIVDFSNVPTFANAQRMENSTKAGSSSFITQDAGQNGYASGILSGTNITSDGVVYGYYDNGETIPLYQIAMYDFHNYQGLRREGGNLYAATKESGEARQGVAGDNGFGAIKAYNIEGSNVDLSREFVNMITTQRGFQANSKGITTVDTMLETVIGMKR